MRIISGTNEITEIIIVGAVLFNFPMVGLISWFWSNEGLPLVNSMFLDFFMRFVVVTQAYVAFIWLISLMFVVRTELLSFTSEYRRKRLTFKEIKRKYYDY